MIDGIVQVPIRFNSGIRSQRNSRSRFSYGKNRDLERTSEANKPTNVWLVLPYHPLIQRASAHIRNWSGMSGYENDLWAPDTVGVAWKNVLPNINKIVSGNLRGSLGGDGRGLCFCAVQGQP